MLIFVFFKDIGQHHVKKDNEICYVACAGMPNVYFSFHRVFHSGLLYEMVCLDRPLVPENPIFKSFEERLTKFSISFSGFSQFLQTYEKIHFNKNDNQLWQQKVKVIVISFLIFRPKFIRFIVFQWKLS